MERGAIGRYVDGEFGGTAYRAFLPGPLPPNPPLELNGLLLRILAAQRALDRMDTMASVLPRRDTLTYSYVRKEAVLSSQIEGSRSSLSDLMSFESSEAPGVPADDDVREVSNYVRALEYGMQRIAEGSPVSNQLIRELHGILLSSGRGNAMYPGRFRHGQNWIGGNHPGNAEFVPPFPEDVEPCMRALERFANNQDNVLPSLIRAGLAHLQFETIHPFFDGNGRVGRLLILLILHLAGDLKYPVLYLSLYLLRHRSVYYRLLDRVRRTGDWEAWLYFFLDGVQESAESALTTMERLAALCDGDRQRIVDSGYPVNSALRVHDALINRPIQPLSVTVEQTGLSFTTAAATMDNLARLGIVDEITGGRRNRLFAYRDYLDALSEDTAVQ